MTLNFHLLQTCTKCTFTVAWRTSANESSAGDISMTDWTTADIPPLNGKTAVITGATGGLGHETALALAAAGAMVVLTGRNDAKGRNAIQSIRARSGKPCFRGRIRCALRSRLPLARSSGQQCRRDGAAATADDGRRL